MDFALEVAAPGPPSGRIPAGGAARGIISPSLSTPYTQTQAGKDLRGPCASSKGGVKATSLASVQGPYSRLAMAGVRGSEVVGFLTIPGRSVR